MARTRKSSSASEKGAPRRRQVAAERAHCSLLRYILDHPEATCKATSDGTRMSFPNVCRLVAGFKTAELIVAREHRQTGRRGPWSQILSLTPGLGCTVGVDLEATQVRGIVLDFGNNVVETLRRPVPAAAGPPEIVALVAESAASLVDWCRKRNRAPSAVGLALPGPVLDVDSGRIRTDLQFGEGMLEFVPPTRAACGGGSVMSMSNTYCFAVGHHRMESAGRPGIEMVILNRFGMGAAMVWDGRLYTGVGDIAGDLGMMRCAVVTPARRFHEVCTGSSLLRLARARGRPQDLHELVRQPDDPMVREWLAEAVPAFAESILVALVAYDPDRTMIEGIFNRFPAELRAGILTRVGEEAVQLGLRAPTIAFYEGDDLMGARGAALLARDRVADDALTQILRAARGQA